MLKIISNLSPQFHQGYLNQFQYCHFHILLILKSLRNSYNYFCNRINLLWRFSYSPWDYGNTEKHFFKTHATFIYFEIIMELVTPFIHPKEKYARFLKIPPNSTKMYHENYFKTALNTSTQECWELELQLLTLGTTHLNFKCLYVVTGTVLNNVVLTYNKLLFIYVNFWLSTP